MSRCLAWAWVRLGRAAVALGLGTLLGLASGCATVELIRFHRAKLIVLL